MHNEEKIITMLSELNEKLDEQYLLQKPILTFNEGCKYLDLFPSTVYKLTSSRQIPHFCPKGKKIYFKRDELDGWLLQNRVSTINEIKSKSLLKKLS